MSEQPIRLAIHDHRPLYAQGLSRVLSCVDGVAVLGSSSTPEELMRLCRAQRPSVLVVDLDQDRPSVLRAAAALRRRRPGVRILALSQTAEEDVRIAAHDAGVESVIPRSGGTAQIVRALLAPSGARPVPFRATPPPRTALGALTSREREVLRLIAGGRTSRDIALMLDVSVKTVENSKRRIFLKLGVQSQSHAVAVAMRSGVLGVTTLAGVWNQ